MAVDTRRFAVLGGGPMGLAAAYQLALDGKQPVLFEADDRLGGMTATFDFNGLDIERYYHFHCLSDAEFFRLLGELGLAERMHWIETRMAFWHGGRLQPWGNPLALLRFRGLSLSAKFRYGLHAWLATRREDWRPLDSIEAVGWIRRWVGEAAYEVLWRRLFEYKFHHLAGNLSAAWIWSRIRRLGRSRRGLMHERLGYLEGGSATFLEATARVIERHGGRIRLGARVDRVEIGQGRVRGVMVDGQLEPFDVVLSTIPLPYVPGVMPDLPQEVLELYRRQCNIAVVCVIAKLARAVSGNFWVNVNDPGMDIPGFVEYSNLRPLGQHVVYVPFYMPGEHPMFAEPDANFIAKVRRYLRTINPQLRDEDFLDVRASRYRHAQPVCAPGHLQGLPPVKLPVQGLWVADTSYYYPEDRGISESVGFGRRMAREAQA